MTNEGFKAFFSRVTLEDKLGTAYEPYIFAALNSAKVMVVLGTRPEYFNAVWVKNEWSRYLALVKESGGQKTLIPAYRDMDPYDLPEEFSHLQAQDMSKLGFMQDLIRGIKKIAKADEPKAAVKETVVIGGNANVAPLLERAFMFLEDGNWADADAYCERVLDQAPKNARAYLGKLMAELRVRLQEDLTNCEQPFDDRSNFQKAVRFGDEKTVSVLNGYIAHINERNENNRRTDIYNRAAAAMNAADSEESFKSAAEIFKTIPGFRDADALAGQCLDKAEVCRKDAIYASAQSQMTGNAVVSYESAIKTFSTISGWKDADEQIYACQRKIEEIKAKEEAERLERERKAEEKRIADEKAAKERKRIAAIVAPIVVACIAFLIVLNMVIIPNGKYNTAVELYNAGKYDEAITAFIALNGYKDSLEQVTKCEAAIKDGKYNTAVALIQKGDIINAYEILIALNGYKDSAEKAKEIFGKYKIEKLKTASVGDIVYFGSYEQDNNTSNGKEDIEWIVLSKYGNKALIISKYALDCKKYNSSYSSVTWETSSLRNWLNGTFLNTAFSTEEQNRIVSSTVTADKNPSYSTSPGNNTTDKVFLLSISEANRYFSSDSARQCRGTAYCYARGAYKGGNGNCWWWLRSPGNISSSAAYVYNDGSVLDGGINVNSDNRAVRPALWINLGS